VNFYSISGQYIVIYPQFQRIENANPTENTTEERSVVEPPTPPSLINRNAQNIVYLGVFLLLLGIIAAIGLVSRKIVLALILTLMLSLAIAALLLAF
jgi:hypothetical protein